MLLHTESYNTMTSEFELIIKKMDKMIALNNIITKKCY